VQPADASGEIVVTHLATSDFPFIRYRTGDVGTLSSERCACGRGLPLLKEIQGRSTDFVVVADGTLLHGLSLIYILRDIPGVPAAMDAAIRALTAPDPEDRPQAASWLSECLTSHAAAGDASPPVARKAVRDDSGRGGTERDTTVSAPQLPARWRRKQGRRVSSPGARWLPSAKAAWRARAGWPC